MDRVGENSIGKANLKKMCFERNVERDQVLVISTIFKEHQFRNLKLISTIIIIWLCLGKVISCQPVKCKYYVISYLTSVSDYIVYYIVISFLRNFKLVWV